MKLHTFDSGVTVLQQTSQVCVCGPSLNKFDTLSAASP
jgi:hypothetical protein